MPEIVNANATLTSPTTNTTQTMATQLTLAASALTTAGFATNDDVVVLYFVNIEGSDNSAETRIQITYAGTPLGPIPARYDFGASGRQRSHAWMVRLDLGGTVSDIDLDMDNAFGSDTATLNKAEILVIKLADLGVENTDWFFDTSTTDVAHTNVYSATNRASVTWTPASVEDWVVLASYHAEINATNRREEMRLNLDSGTIIAGDFSEEGESATEEKRHIIFDVITSLAVSSHTLAVESRDHSGGTTNAHLASALLIFRKDIFTDIYIDEAGSVAVVNDTDVQVATLTDTLSVTQNAILLGTGNYETPAADFDEGFMWIREGGSTVLEPALDFTGGDSCYIAFEDFDDGHCYIVAYENLTSGALDLDLFFHQNGTATENLLDTKFLVWGMELAAAVYPPFPRRQNTLVRM